MGLFTVRPIKSVSVGGEYFASHPNIRAYYQAMALTMTDTAVEVTDNMKAIHTFKWNEITGFDTQEVVEKDVRSRLTVTRMVTLGIFSLATPKATGSIATQFLYTLHTTTGDIELEVKIEGSPGSTIIGAATKFVQKNGQKVRAYVAGHARG